VYLLFVKFIFELIPISCFQFIDDTDAGKEACYDKKVHPTDR